MECFSYSKNLSAAIALVSVNALARAGRAVSGRKYRPAATAFRRNILLLRRIHHFRVALKKRRVFGEDVAEEFLFDGSEFKPLSLVLGIRFWIPAAVFDNHLNRAVNTALVAIELSARAGIGVGHAGWGKSVCRFKS